jgi:hypothetical protein
MHSDVDTIERIEIIRDLRLGVFDVLIGINLLRDRCRQGGVPALAHLADPDDRPRRAACRGSRDPLCRPPDRQFEGGD